MRQLLLSLYNALFGGFSKPFLKASEDPVWGVLGTLSGRFREPFWEPLWVSFWGFSVVLKPF